MNIRAFGTGPMKYCSRCGMEYEDGVGRCPEDGAPLVPAPASGAGATGRDPQARATETLRLEDSHEALEKTSEMAREIEDLILKVCSHCHSAYHGDVEVCPEDGTRLIEPSVLARQSLFVQGGDPNTALFELKKYCPSCNLHFDLDDDECGQCGRLLAIPTLGGRPGAGRDFAATDALIGEKYRILDTIDSGGFGCVLLAKHESLGKRFAIKVLRGALSDTREFRNRFHEEALKLSRLEDENVVKVFDFGENEDSQYMVTEYVDGRDLGAIIYEEKVSPVRAAKIMRQVAGALAEAHSKKIVHLDLKPRNILVTEKRGRDLVKVIDFGIAEIYTESGASRQETVAGTATYMAPEQWRRRPLDPRTDIYSFGVIFYELLAGRPPFRQTKVSEIERAHLKETPPPLRKLRPDVPVELEKLIQQCMEKKPERRVQSAEELEARLQAYVGRTENVLRRWVVRVATLLAVATLIVTAVLGVWSAQRDTTAPSFTSFAARADTVEALQEVSRDDLSVSYRTRVKRAVFRYEVEDDRGIEEVRLSSDLFDGGELRRTEPEDEIPVSLPVGVSSVTAVAFDAAGNPSRPVKVGFTVLRPAGFDYELDPAASYTNSGSVRVRIRNLSEDVEVGIVRRSANDAQPSRVVANSAGDRVIPLKPGDNELRIVGTDLLTGIEFEKGSHTIRYLNAVFPVRATIEAAADRTFEQSGQWLTSEPHVVVLVQVPGSGRLKKGEELRYRLNGNDRLVGLSDGENRLELTLTKEGRNEIVIQPISDIYGNPSEEILLTAVLDTVKPELRLESDEIEFFGEVRPRIRFTCGETHLGAAGDAFAVLDRESQAVNPRSFEIDQDPSGTWELRFRDRSSFPDDGTHHLSIQARDRVRNEATVDFSILVDQTRPTIKVQSVSISGYEQERIRRGEEIIFKIRVDDTYPDRVQVKADVLVDSPDGERRSTFELARDPENERIRTLTLRVANGGIEKPRIFTRKSPGFQVTFKVADAAGRTAEAVEQVLFAWENGDRLIWKDGSTLVFHDRGRVNNNRDEVPAFFIQETEVSNEQYALFLHANPNHPVPKSRDWSGRTVKSERRHWPVRNVTPRDAEAYASWAGLRLASTREWKVAAFFNYESSRSRDFPWGDDRYDRGARAHPIHCRLSTQPVSVVDSAYEGGRTPSGLFHMFGNVWEITRDREVAEYPIMGGGFNVIQQLFENANDEYIRGNTRFEDSGSDYATGFRCTLPAFE